MTLRQQDVQQAVQQAEQQTLTQTALRMLDEKFDIKIISKITNLSLDEIKRLARKKIRVFVYPVFRGWPIYNLVRNSSDVHTRSYRKIATLLAFINS